MEYFDLISPIEDAIIDRLKDKTGNKVLVEPYPDNPESYEPTHQVGALLVRYSDGNYSGARTTDVIVQDREMMFEVTLAMWSLRGRQGGIYSYLEAVRQILTGFRPPDTSLKLVPVDEGYVNRSAGLRNKSQRLWQYQVTFRTQTVNIEILVDPAEPLLKRITAQDNLGNTTEVN